MAILANMYSHNSADCVPNIYFIQSSLPPPRLPSLNLYPPTLEGFKACLNSLTLSEREKNYLFSCASRDDVILSTAWEVYLRLDDIEDFSDTLTRYVAAMDPNLRLPPPVPPHLLCDTL